MKTIITTEAKGIEAIKTFFNDFLPTKEESKEIDKTYSLGFVRMSKLSRSMKLDCFKALFYEGYTDTSLNTQELKRRLEMMSEEEYETFKTK